ncbi:MAG TPA: ABC transporter substrate-binding protein [Pseudolabrys sp.]|nr:ABC transporter substrate-binding protein [Pseudolabrys sp.]
MTNRFGWRAGIAGAALAGAGLLSANAAQAECAAMRKISIGVSVSPPNVVHTTPYVARELGLFAKHCIDVNIIQFDGGGSPAAKAAAAQGTALVSVQPVAIGHGVKVKQIWTLAPRMPQSYTVDKDVKTAADLKGKRLSAAGGGVGSFNWIMGREVLKSGGLKPEDANFISATTAARLTGLIAGQIDGVSLHPEDVYLAKKKNEGLHVLVQLAELMPDWVFNSYGGQIAWVEKDRATMVDAVAAMIEANRAIYREKDKVIPIMVKATGKPKEAVEYAWDVETKNCIWSVNEGFDPKRTQWSIDNDVANGFIKADSKPSVDRVFDEKLAAEAVKAAGGRVTIGKCSL